MSSLMTAAQVKALLGLEDDDDTYDEALVRLLPLVTSWFEGYCDRGLALREGAVDEVHGNRNRKIYTWAVPIIELTSVEVDGTVYLGSDYVVNKAAGYFVPGPTRPYIESADLIRVTYDGGFADETVPNDLAFAFASAVGIQAGIPSAVAITGGSGAIKSIGLGGGALSVAFDTSSSSSAGGIQGAYGVDWVPVELQNYAGVLDRYVRRSV